MRIGSDKKLHRALKRLFESERENEDISSLFNDFLGIPQEEVSMEGERLGESLPYEDFLLSFFDGAFPPYVKRKLSEGILEIDPEERLIHNPYWKALRGMNCSEGGLSLASKEVLPFCLFPYSGISTGPAPYYEEKNGFAYSRQPFSSPEFKQNGRPWMSLVPHELVTMEGAIARANGKVLTYGLGMGYFAFMASLKDDVTSVTVLEKDRRILSFFRENLLPRFPKKEKIVLIEDDAIEFASRQGKGSYDFLFADIYHDAEDGLPLYLKLRQTEGAAKENSYWIEGDLLVYLRRYFVAFLEEQSDPEIKSKGEEAYPKGESFQDALFRAIYLNCQEKELNSVEDLSEFLSVDSLKRTAKSLKI